MESEVILTTERLRLRKLTHDDLPLLEKSLCDARVMYAYEHGLSRDEALEWLERQIARYSSDGCGLWGVERLSDGTFLGQCGITMQPLYDTLVPEIGYVFDDEYWGFGYATEAAQACKKYGFEVMGAAELFSIIRGNNLPSIKVAERNGMTPRRRSSVTRLLLIPHQKYFWRGPLYGTALL